MARARANHSMAAILEEAVAMLDEGGEPGLTLRGLAARLGGGVGSLYWYVRSRDELLARATDHLVAETLERADAELARRRSVRADPVKSLRLLSLALFETLGAHPWAATYLMRDIDIQLSSMRYWDRVGQLVLRLGLTGYDALYGASAVTSFVVGEAAQLSYQGPPEDHEGRAFAMAQTLERWSALPEDEFPYTHAVIPLFARHDDVAQFTYGLDLLLSGLAAKAGR